MLDKNTPRPKLGPPSRGSSFYIENLLRTAYREASAEERVDTPSFKVTVRSPGVCPVLETKRLDDSKVLDWSGTSPNAAHGTPRSPQSKNGHTDPGPASDRDSPAMRAPPEEKGDDSLTDDREEDDARSSYSCDTEWHRAGDADRLASDVATSARLLEFYQLPIDFPLQSSGVLHSTTDDWTG
ncbi:hypothetical protein FQN60_007258, partial [Etheostoma spectabile]